MVSAGTSTVSLTCVCVAELRGKSDVIYGHASSFGTVEGHLKHHLEHTQTHTGADELRTNHAVMEEADADVAAGVKQVIQTNTA